jgi:IS605 OrfB family transposase
MYETTKTLVEGLTDEEYKLIRELCSISGRLYNSALYNYRQEFFKTGKLLTYPDIYVDLKTSPHYKLLQAGCAQQTLKHVDRAMKSFQALSKLADAGEYPEDAVRLPRYKRGEKYYGIWCSTNAITIHNRMFMVPFSRDFKAEHHQEIWIPVPEHVDIERLKEVSILPDKHGVMFTIAFVCDVEPDDKHLSKRNALGIDVGVDNLMACVSTTGDTFIVDGRTAKSYNQYYNKRYAKLKSIATVDAIGKREVREGDRIPTTKRMSRMNRHRDNYMTDYMRKSARIVVDYCIAHDIGTIVIGRNKGWKHRVSMGDANNQNFVSLPYTKLYTQLSYLCEKYGLEYVEVNEAYTSKASCLDWDVIPSRRGGKHSFSGLRKHRGLYESASGRVVNADVNGAGNILRKGKQDMDSLSVLGLCSGLLASPTRLRVS